MLHANGVNGKCESMEQVTSILQEYLNKHKESTVKLNQIEMKNIKLIDQLATSRGFEEKVVKMTREIEHKNKQLLGKNHELNEIKNSFGLLLDKE